MTALGRTILQLALVGAVSLAGRPALAWSLADLFAPCTGDCATAIYAGVYVDDAMSELLLTSPKPPTAWAYGEGEHLVATAVSREVARFGGRWSLEPEVGLGRRIGGQAATEAWGALFLRYSGFPWDGVVVTTAAVSTGMNWASTITPAERDRARDDTGSQWMHFFSPEITFALPGRPHQELLFRFHHRSGVFGLVSDAWGGAQYATVGVRVRF